MKLSNMMKWWILFCLQVFSLILMYRYGIYSIMLEVDKTFISFIILGICMAATVGIGATLYTKSKAHEILIEYAPKLCITLGLLGTVIGLAFMLEAMSEMNISGVEHIPEVIRVLIDNIGTAVWTTLVGLVAATVIEVQLLLTGGKYES